MDPKLVVKALDAIEAGDAEAAVSILKGLIASAAGAEPDADGEGDPSDTGDPDGGDGAEPSDDDLAAPEADGNPPEDGREPAKPAEGDPPPKGPSKASARTLAATGAILQRLTGKSTFAEAIDAIEIYKASHVELETGREQLAAERAVLERAERRRLCAELVRLGAEFPSTVWADDKATRVKPRWANLPIADFRAHVAEQKAARGDKPRRAPEPERSPVRGAGPGAVALSARELAICKETGCDPEGYAQLKAEQAKYPTGAHAVKG